MYITVDNAIQRNFGQVPNGIWLVENLSGAAKAQFAALCCVRPMESLTVAELDRRCGHGRDKGQAARKQLEAKGLIEYQTPVDKYGRAKGKTIRLNVGVLVEFNGGELPDVDRQNNRTPENQAVGENNVSSGGFHRTPENQSVGKSGNVLPDSQADIRKQKSPHPQTRPKAAAADAGAVIEKISEKRESPDFAQEFLQRNKRYVRTELQPLQPVDGLQGRKPRQSR